MKQFQFHQPQTTAEACSLLAELGASACLLAGGTDLIVKMKKGLVAPGHVIDLKKLSDLAFIRETDDGYMLGALTRLTSLVEHPGLRERIPVLGRSALTIGSSQVRNLATLGGNLCNAAPSADMVPGLLTLEATVNIMGPNGKRNTSLEAFFRGPGEVDLAAAELLTEVAVPFPAAGCRSIYLKHGPRKAMDCAVVGVAVSLVLEEGSGCCRKVRIALGAVAPTAVRLREAETLLCGKQLQEISQPELARAVQAGIEPISDVRGSEAYRYDVAAALTWRAVYFLMHGKEG